MSKYRCVRLVITGVFTGFMAIGWSAAAAASANISHSYQATGTVTSGALVGLDTSHSGFVQEANSGNGAHLLGVAVANNDSLLAVDPTTGRVQVATSGNANALVSTVNGSIKVGDPIAVSPFDGIGMEAEAGDHIVGLAQTAFNSTTSGAVSQQVTDKSGHKSTIQVGYVRVSVAIGVDSVSGTTGLNSLQQFAQNLTGHAVSLPRVILSLIIAIVALIALMSLIYASIYGSIVSIGRNPLAKFAVFRTLGSIMAMVVVTAGLAGATIFLLLR